MMIKKLINNWINKSFDPTRCPPDIKILHFMCCVESFICVVSLVVFAYLIGVHCKSCLLQARIGAVIFSALCITGFVSNIILWTYELYIKG